MTVYEYPCNLCRQGINSYDIDLILQKYSIFSTKKLNDTINM